MTSMQGYNTPTDYTYMYEVKDYRSNRTVPNYPEDSLTGVVFNDKNLSKFKHLLIKSNYALRYAQPVLESANMTFFVTPDEFIDLDDNVFLNMDLYTARQIVLYNTVQRVINPESFTSIRDIFEFKTRIEDSFITIANLGSGIYINDARIIGMKRVSNGIIYFLDKLLVPKPMYQ